MGDFQPGTEILLVFLLYLPVMSSVMGHIPRNRKMCPEINQVKFVCFMIIASQKS
jgi:hypothetical protein